MPISHQDLTARAFRAYFRYNDDPSPDQPNRMSGVEMGANGRPYVVLRGGRFGNGICAVYRVRTDGRLKRLERWPSDLE